MYPRARVLLPGLRSPINRVSEASASFFIGQEHCSNRLSPTRARGILHKKADTRSRMIPDCNDDGYLPPGIHPATLDQIAARFGRESELRQAQMESLCWLVDLAQGAETACCE